MHKNLLRVYPNPAPIRLDKFFKSCLPRLSYASLQKYIRKGHIRLKNQKTSPSSLLGYGDEIAMSSVLTEAFPDLSQKKTASTTKVVALEPSDIAMFQEGILYEDDQVIVWNKPQGLAVQGGTRLYKHLDGVLIAMAAEGLFSTQERPRLVHRLDKDTSGILLLAKTLAMTTFLMKAFQEHRVQKEYVALIEGIMPEQEGVIEVPLSKKEIQGTEKVVVDYAEGRTATTLYKTIQSYKSDYSLVNLFPKTGRTHQLRVHCATMNAPIVGDGKYGAKGRAILPKKTTLCLHAYGITFPLLSGEMKTFYTPLPRAFKDILPLLDFNKTWDLYNAEKIQKRD